MRVKALANVEVRFSSGEKYRLPKGGEFEFPDHLGCKLIRKTEGRVMAVPDPDLTPNGQRWLKGWHVVVGLPFLPKGNHRTWARKAMIEECDRHFQNGCLPLFEHAVGKLRGLIKF